MKTVSVQASRNYDVLIGSGLLSSLGTLLKSVTKASKAAVISETPGPQINIKDGP